MQHNFFATNRGALSMKPESDLSITIFETINDNILFVIFLKKNLHFPVTHFQSAKNNYNFYMSTCLLYTKHSK